MPAVFSSSSPPHPFRGVLYLVVALLLFACLDVTIKQLASHFPVPVVIAVRYVVHFSLMTAMLAPRAGKQLVVTQRTGLVLIRGACLLVVSLFMTLALQRMPVAEATSIQFLAPMLVVLLARPVLGERIGLARWVSVIAGFCGVVLIARPGGQVDLLGLGFLICSVMAGAAYQLLSRILIRTEQAIAMLFYTALMGSLCFGALVPAYWSGVWPTGTEILLFLSLGVTGGLGHLLFTLAYREAPASVLAPVNYLQLVWAGMLGWLVFDQIPDGLGLLGMAIVAASGVFIALHSRAQADAA